MQILGDVIFATIDKNGTGCNRQIFLSYQWLQRIQYAWYIFFQEPNKRGLHFETIPNTGPISRKKPIIIEWMEKIFDSLPLFFRYLPKVIPFFQTPKKHWLFCVSNISSINFNCDAFLGLLLDQSWSDKR